ncbi:hypothetical protein OO013_19275 [Mangrovivirga sp. M17]|uniref:Lipocalin-like domain-containing protein n=1 Tax=Mangrovivirga halotolerans TaxID=2993936 RepID=A0ABT3RW74_9BACT|nr:hypothetical protein [Mangrovivirga halotolerans]MCX2746030.1 hypothetical protein [Mangrovivirga halotolerans]
MEIILRNKIFVMVILFISQSCQDNRSLEEKLNGSWSGNFNEDTITLNFVTKDKLIYSSTNINNQERHYSLMNDSLLEINNTTYKIIFKRKDEFSLSPLDSNIWNRESLNIIYLISFKKK